MVSRTDSDDFKKKRFQFLLKCHKLSGAHESFRLDMDEVGKELGFEPEVKNAVVDYLLQEGSIKSLGIGSVISITARGIAQVERTRA